MLDGFLKSRLDPLTDALARPLARAGVTADQVTLAGCAFSLFAGVALAAGGTGPAFALFLAGRACDGVDGALARVRGGSTRGGILDIVCDFVAYAAIPLGFAVASPGNALPAALLLAAITINAASFFAVAAVSAVRGARSSYAGPKAIPYSAGLMEGTETILAYVLMLAVPAWFGAIAVVFAMLCLVTAVLRIVAFGPSTAGDGDTVLLDSISHVGPEHAGRVVVTGSHGGAAAADFVRPIAVAGLVFNDAGAGKDDAGLHALETLAARDVPAVAVAHTSARIGEAKDTLESGFVSAMNVPAAARGITAGMAAREVVLRLGGRR